MSDAKALIGELLEADEQYRRDLGAFGPDDIRTKVRLHRFEASLKTMKWWYNSRFVK